MCRDVSDLYDDEKDEKYWNYRLQSMSPNIFNSTEKGDAKCASKAMAMERGASYTECGDESCEKFKTCIVSKGKTKPAEQANGIDG